MSRFYTKAREQLRGMGAGSKFTIEELMPLAEEMGINRRGVWDLLDRMVRAGEITLVKKVKQAKGGHPKSVYEVVEVLTSGLAYARGNIMRDHLREWYEPGDILTCDDVISAIGSGTSAMLNHLAKRGELEKVGKRKAGVGRRRTTYKIVKLAEERKLEKPIERKVPKEALVIPAPSGWGGLLIRR